VTGARDAAARPRTRQRPRARTRLRDRPFFVPLLLGVVVAVVHSLSPTPQSGDSRLSVVTAWRFATHFDLRLEGYPAVQALAAQGDLVASGGHLVPFFPWPTMLLALPGTLVAALFGVDPGALSIADPNLTWLVEVPTASVMVALTAVLLHRIVLTLPQPWATPRTALVTALVFAFGSMAWSVGSRALWQQTASMLFIAAAVVALQRLERRPRWGLLLGLWLTLAVVMRPTNAILFALIALWVLWRRRSAFLPAVGGAAIVAVPFAAFSFSQYGTVLPAYYLPTRMVSTGVYELAESIAVNLVSPSRGLLFFAPVLVIAAIGVVLRLRGKTFTSVDLVFILAFACQFVVIARFGSTHGFTFGPRLMLDTLPLLMILAVPALSRLAHPRRETGAAATALVAAVGLLVAAGFFVNATGALLRSAVCWNVSPVLLDAAPERVWDWGDVQFLRPYALLAEGTAPIDLVAPSCTTNLAVSPGAIR